MSILSERLKYFVEQKGYSIADLAGRSGIERATLYQYLKGSRPLKNHVHLETLMAELQLTPDERQEVLEAYEITQIGQVQYNRRCKVREILNSLLTIEEKTSVVPKLEQEMYLRTAEGQRLIQGELEINRLVSNIIYENVIRGGELRLLTQPDNDLLMESLLLLCDDNIQTKVTQIICLEAGGGRDGCRNLENIRRILRYGVGIRHYEPRYYYGRPAEHYGVMNVMPYLVVTDRCAVQISSDWKAAILHSEPAVVTYFRHFFEDTSDNGGVHTNSSLVYHAAYLMTEYGMSEDTLAKLWYKSLGMGYDATSTFQTVRINVLKAARKIKLSDIEIERIKKAFDEVEIYETQNDLGNVPEEAVEYNGHYYYVYDIDTITDWNMAQEYCEEQGGYLATITSQEENDFVYAYLEEYDYESAYFGFTDQEEEGNWKWVNGEISSYTNWHSGEPNSENTNEDFAMYYYKFSDGTWNDGDFGNRTANGGRAFICEWGE